MSHTRLKIKYNTEGSYGSIEERTLFAHHNHSCDYLTFYDEDGSIILTVPDSIENNILDAMNSLIRPWKSGSSDELCDGIEYLTVDEFKRIGI